MKNLNTTNIWAKLIFGNFCGFFPRICQEYPDGLQDDLQLIVNPLIQYFPYLQRTRDISIPRYLAFWIAKSDDLAEWFECLKFIALVQPSSAAAERVFYLLRTKFSDHQESTLEDYKACSVMMEFNRRSLVGVGSGNGSGSGQ